jgi:hypothetical protein
MSCWAEMTIEHGPVDLHAQVGGLPVESHHLYTALPKGERVGVGRRDAAAVRIYSHHVSHVVEIQLTLWLARLILLGKGFLLEREDMVVHLGLGRVEALKLDSDAVHAEIPKHRVDLARAARLAAGRVLLAVALILTRAAARRVVDFTFRNRIGGVHMTVRARERRRARERARGHNCVVHGQRPLVRGRLAVASPPRAFHGQLGLLDLDEDALF